MNLKNNFPILIIIGIVVVAMVHLATDPHALLFNPKGMIALSERNLAIKAVLMMLIIVIPTLIIFVMTVLKYKVGSPRGKYNPDWQRSKYLVALWWIAPSIIVFFLAIMNWKSTHALDPFTPINSNTQPVTIQVVALRWKWLFIYPEQGIATVNFIQFPEHTPINFQLTADAPMSSFWIPQLGGQMYAMTGMGTKLHLIADHAGDFDGSAAEINGAGFSGMKFLARASSQADFDDWVTMVKKSPNTLNLSEYKKLAQPSEDNPVILYSSSENGLYNNVMMKFMEGAMK